MSATPQIEMACKALEDLRRRLITLARAGSLTPSLLQAAVDDCADAVLVTDDKARMVMGNGAAARLIGTSTRELQKLSVWDITHATYQADFDLLWKEFLRAGRQRGRYGIRRRDGSMIEVAYCAEAHVLAGRCVFVLCRLG